MQENYFTLTSYLHENKLITYENLHNKSLTITKLSTLLNIKKPSCSKMISKLKNFNLVNYKNNSITLTKSGFHIAKYLYYRHNILTLFLTKINKQDFKLEQVEKIEHFIDSKTLKNIAKLNLKL